MENILIDLLKIPSVSSNIEKINEIINYVEEYFKNTNAIIEKFEFNKKPSIIIKNFEGKKWDIVLNWHLDVVPPSEENQFIPYKKDWKIYARWAWDMKSGVVVMMKLMKDLLQKWFNEKKISLILTTDEEVGGFDWVWKLVDLWYSWDVVLIPDNGSLEKIIYSEKGILILDLEFYWISAHSSRPWLWENAINNMFKFYQMLTNYIQDEKKLFFSKQHWWSSVSLNMVKWWIAINAIADKVNAIFDIRFTEDFDSKELLKIVKKFLLRTNWKIKEFISWEVLYTNPNNKNLKKYLNIVQKYNNKAYLTKEHWASDARFFSKTWAIVILHRPTCSNVHSKNEWVKLDDLNIIYKCYYEFIVE